MFVSLYLADSTNVSIDVVSVPPGTPVNGSTNTFDYPLFSNVSLVCALTSIADGSSVYSSMKFWQFQNCYTHNSGVMDPCFYNGYPNGESLYGYNILAQDAGSTRCYAGHNLGFYVSDIFTFRVSGEQL